MYIEFKQLSKDIYQLRKCIQLIRNILGSLHCHATDLEEESRSRICDISDHIAWLILDMESSIKQLQELANKIMEED